MSSPEPGPSLRHLVSTALRVAFARPRLAWEALRFAAATAAPRWWARPPFVPVPEPTYRAWRMTTAYGRADGELTVEELGALLEWRIEMRRARR